MAHKLQPRARWRRLSCALAEVCAQLVLWRMDVCLAAPMGDSEASLVVGGGVRLACVPAEVTEGHRPDDHALRLRCCLKRDRYFCDIARNLLSGRRTWAATFFSPGFVCVSDRAAWRESAQRACARGQHQLAVLHPDHGLPPELCALVLDYWLWSPRSLADLWSHPAP